MGARCEHATTRVFENILTNDTYPHIHAFTVVFAHQWRDNFMCEHVPCILCKSTSHMRSVDITKTAMQSGTVTYLIASLLWQQKRKQLASQQSAELQRRQQRRLRRSAQSAHDASPTLSHFQKNRFGGFFDCRNFNNSDFSLSCQAVFMLE